MAMTSLKGGIMWPPPNMIPLPLGNPSSTVNILGRQLSVAGEKVAFVFQAPATDSVTDVAIIVHTVGSSGDVDVRLETVDAATGAPTGTLAATNTNIVKTISATGKLICTLTAAASLTKGNFYAVVLARSTGNYHIAYYGDSSSRLLPHSYGAYLRHHNGTSWQSRTADVARYSPIFALKFTTASWTPVVGAVPISTVTKSVYNNTSATRERGLALVARAPMRVFGFFLLGQLGTTNFEVILASTGGSAHLTHVGDKDYVSNYFAGLGSNYSFWSSGIFDSTYDLVAGTTYYLTLKPTSATDLNLAEVSIIDTADATSIGALNGGADMKLVTRDSGGSYTVGDTARPLSMGLLVSHLDDGAGGGSGGGPLTGRRLVE